LKKLRPRCRNPYEGIAGAPEFMLKQFNPGASAPTKGGKKHGKKL